MERTVGPTDDVDMFERLSPTARKALRIAAGIVLGIAAGCFIECSDPNPVGGGLLLAAAVAGAAVTVTSVVWGIVGWNRLVLVRVAASVAALAALVVLVSVSGF